MGTNYYVKSKTCECCDHTPEQIHIGKSSAGWTFSFHALETVRSWADWKIFLKGETIVDEYGETMALEEFERLVESKMGEPNNHTIYCKTYYLGGNAFLDPEGHSFSEYVFS